MTKYKIFGHSTEEKMHDIIPEASTTVEAEYPEEAVRKILNKPSWSQLKKYKHFTVVPVSRFSKISKGTGLQGTELNLW